MGRKARRVPLDFKWPLNKTWSGYFMPDYLREIGCEACDRTGYSPLARRLQDQWHGRAPFEPEDNGSTPLSPDHPGIRRLAERNVVASPAHYGTGESAIEREAQRLADLFNGWWSHHLNEQDISDLRAAGFIGGNVTIDQVRAAAADGNLPETGWMYALVKARCDRAGEPETCTECDGHGTVEVWSGQRAAADAWGWVEPPTGDGWQMWETTSEGSPISPVFTDPEDLADWCAEHATVFGPMRADRAWWLGLINGSNAGAVELQPGVFVV